ncbi:MAG: SAM-dependent methyltransferase [Deltaproteobacteria bacterium]|nr:SAM-dependent methyltransferase [Deltaproteobacteria bacterium]MBW2414018.1 SAM-dependent methyltransferase [Deltaproteobacteria bacterium]
MFDLQPPERGGLSGRILGCGDGPASFNCELTRKGGSVVSLDPLYAASRDEIAARIDETFDDVIGQTRREQHQFVWDAISSVEELGRVRMSAMQMFLQDYDAGRSEGRYREGGLPELPLEDGEFDLALCSHLLFFYAEQLPVEFHVDGLTELCRVARQVRVFPLVDVNAAPSPHLDPALERLRALGLTPRVERVPYEFQRGGNEMLVVDCGG